jgi:integrase
MEFAMINTYEQHQLSIEDGYRIIADARNYHKINQSRDIRNKTRDYYNKVARRLLFSDRVLPVDAAKSKSSYYVYRAAVTSFVMDAISNVLPSMDALRQSNEQNWLDEVGHLKTYVDFLNTIEIDYNKEKLTAFREGTYVSDWSRNQKNSQSKNRKSKSRRLKTLPKDWSEKLFTCAIETKSKHILAIATLAISGCRPVELESTVKLILNTDQTISIEINGAKTHSGKYGQQFRRYDIKSESQEYYYLRDELKKNYGTLTVTAPAGAVCDKVSYLSRKAMPGLKENASAYCFRHRFSGNLHRLGLATYEIAKALGHCSDQSQQNYSKAYKSGANGFSIYNIVSAREVSLKNNMRARSKCSIPSIK